MGDDRPNVYVEDGVVIYRASSLGNCIRSLVASRLEMEPMPHPEFLLKAFDEGNRNEPIILQHLNDNGYTLENTGEGEQLEVEIPIGTGIKIRCHPDGIGYKDLDVDQRRVIEAKAFGKTLWDKYHKTGIDSFPYYRMQVSIEMAGTGLPCLFVVGLKNVDEGMVCDQFVTTLIEKPPIGIGEIKLKVLQIEKWAKKGELPPCDYDQYPCQFYHLHDEDNDQGGTVVDEDLEVDAILSVYVKGQRLEKQGKELKKPAGEELLKIMETRGELKIDRAEHIVTTTTRADQKINWDAVADEVGKDVIARHTTTKLVRFVTVREKKK